MLKREVSLIKDLAVTYAEKTRRSNTFASGREIMGGKGSLCTRKGKAIGAYNGFIVANYSASEDMTSIIV